MTGRSPLPARMIDAVRTEAQATTQGCRTMGERGLDKYKLVLSMAQRQQPVTVAVVHPCDEVSLTGAVEAHRLGLIVPSLVAPESRLRALAQSCGIDLTGFTILP